MFALNIESAPAPRRQRRLPRRTGSSARYVEASPLQRDVLAAEWKLLAGAVGEQPRRRELTTSIRRTSRRAAMQPAIGVSDGVAAATASGWPGTLKTASTPRPPDALATLEHQHRRGPFSSSVIAVSRPREARAPITITPSSPEPVAAVRAKLAGWRGWVGGGGRWTRRPEENDEVATRDRHGVMLPNPGDSSTAMRRPDQFAGGRGVLAATRSNAAPLEASINAASGSAT